MEEIKAAGLQSYYTEHGCALFLSLIHIFLLTSHSIDHKPDNNSE